MVPIGPLQDCNGIALPLPLPLLCWVFQFTALFLALLLSSYYFSHLVLTVIFQSVCSVHNGVA